MGPHQTLGCPCHHSPSARSHPPSASGQVQSWPSQPQSRMSAAKINQPESGSALDQFSHRQYQAYIVSVLGQHRTTLWSYPKSWRSYLPSTIPLTHSAKCTRVSCNETWMSCLRAFISSKCAHLAQVYDNLASLWKGYSIYNGVDFGCAEHCSNGSSPKHFECHSSSDRAAGQNLHMSFVCYHLAHETVHELLWLSNPQLQQ